MLFSVVVVPAQGLKVKSLAVVDNDLSASKYIQKDLNQRPCALVKVLLPADGAIFEGNVIGKVEYKVGEYWVYLSEGSYELRIKHPMSTPLLVNFRDYGINCVQSMVTYELMISLNDVDDSKKVIIRPKDESLQTMNQIKNRIQSMGISGITHFLNGLAAVKKNGKWAFIDKSGIQKTAFDFYEVIDTHELWVVKKKKNGPVGVVNEKGVLIIPCEYDDIGKACKDSVLVRKKDKYALFDNNGIRKSAFVNVGSWQCSALFGRRPPYVEHYERYVDANGKSVFKHNYSLVLDYSEGYACAKKKNGQWDVIDLNGSVITSLPMNLTPYDKDYHLKIGFHEGLLPVKDSNQNNKIGYIDISGKVVIPCRYDIADDFSQGLAAVGTGISDVADDSSQDIAAVEMGKPQKINRSFINKNGNVVINCGNGYISCQKFNNRGWVLMSLYEPNRKNGNQFPQVLMDKTGKILLRGWSNSLEKLWSEERFDFKLAPFAIEKDGKKVCGYLDENLNLVIPAQYQYVSSFKDEFAVLRDMEGQYGLIDSYGNIVMLEVFDNS